MENTALCPACGRPLPADAPQGICPQCLLKGVLPSGIDAGAPTTQAAARHARFVAPTVEEIARHFPQLEVLELIGQGGMGAVYKARQKQLDRFVAIKILPPTIGHEPGFAERFAREARAMAKLSHAGIVVIHDFGQTDGLFYFLMEYIDGVTLRQLLEGGRVSPREALAIVPQICDALQYAHDRGIVHRDIKPENILVDRQGRVKVADFGVAKLIGAEAEHTTATTEAGIVVGTPQYMAPEQRERPQEVDHRADIYALGVVFYQLLTGELPGGRIEPPSKLVEIDVRLDEIVLKAMAREPERRYQQASDVKTQVETVAATTRRDVTAAQDQARGVGRGAGRGPRGWLALALLLAPPAAFLWWLLVGGQRLGFDLDADIRFFAGVLGLPLSAGVGALMAWAGEILASFFVTAPPANAPPVRWSWRVIVSTVLLVLSLPLGGGAIVLAQLLQRQANWNPGSEEFVMTAVLVGGTLLIATAATLMGIEALRRLRGVSGSAGGRRAASAAACFWPTMIALTAVLFALAGRDDQREIQAAEQAQRQQLAQAERIAQAQAQPSAAAQAPAAARQPAAADAKPATALALVNTGMEEGTKTPLGWEKGAAVPGVVYTWDRGEAHEGKASLRLQKTQPRYFPIAQWQQAIANPGTTSKVKVSAWVKAERATKGIVDVMFLSKDGQMTHQWIGYIGAKDAGDPPVTHDWKEYTGVAEIPNGTAKLAIAFQIYGPGKLWFDDVRAEFVPDVTPVTDAVE